MANYIKSEFYRVFHGRSVYLLTVILTILVIAFNLILYGFGRMDGEFPYATVHFSFTTLIGSMRIWLYGALLITVFLTADEYKNGAIKNTIAGGISRNQIFLGKCVVYGSAALLSASVILAGFIASAYALLERETSNVLEIMLKGCAANLTSAFAALILTVALYCILEREIQVVIWWFVVVCGIPTVFFVLGFEMAIFNRIAEWMPFNYLQYEVSFVFSESKVQALWMEPEGMAKCIIAGAIGIVVFLTVGILGFRKKDL